MSLMLTSLLFLAFFQLRIYRLYKSLVCISFSIALGADFDEEVMDVLEMMEDEVASQEVIFQSAME
jgi:hypothetical protein